jgi:hypothetical protein
MTQTITGIIGTSISALGVATSPILWGLVICTIDSNAEMCKTKTSSTVIERQATDTLAEPAVQTPAPATPAQGQ